MIVRSAPAFPVYRIAPGDTNKLAILHAPDDGADLTIVFEVWEPGGAQPPNSHPRSVETFLFLAGEGIAVCDGEERAVGAGDLLALPAGSVHQIRNTGLGRLYAITTMVPDDGFAALIRNGVADHLDGDDLAVLGCR